MSIRTLIYSALDLARDAAAGATDLAQNVADKAYEAVLEAGGTEAQAAAVKKSILDDAL